MIRFHSKWSIVLTLAVSASVVFVLPAFVAFRYTAPAQRSQFVSHPWHGWSFAYAALAVPTDSQLKTSGMALRKADWIFKDTAVDPHEVQLLFVAQDEPYTFTHDIGERTVTDTVTPKYRFIWEVRGAIRTVASSGDVIVALLDYESGRMLYDVRDDFRPSELLTPAESTSEL